MNEDYHKGKQKLWYVRREKEVTGPFPSGAVRRSLLLGRVLLTDEVSFDGKKWQHASAVPEVVPPELRKAVEEGDDSALLVARRREDTRTGCDRRNALMSDCAFESKRKGERRTEERNDVGKRRAARRALLQQKREGVPVRAVAISLLVVLGVIGYGLYIGSSADSVEAECGRPPVPEINWSNCRLDGMQFLSANLVRADLSGALLRGAKLSGSLFKEAKLEYADFSGADLSYAQFSGARMKGANLQYADLTYGVFSGADLSFAIFRGANPGGVVLDGARLDHAIWFDGTTCLAGSIGGCKRKTERR